jgi:YegS/Rv2252/BmrU family lipid kinase
MRHYFVINPTAGKPNTAQELTSKIASAANTTDIIFRVYEAKSKEDATRYVTEKCEKHPDETLRFYACGGDGTLNVVINAASGFANTEVAVIPVGTGNDFVKNFTNTKNFMNMKRQILGTPVKIDLIKFNGRYCANVLNIGFDCSVVQKMGQFRRSKFVPNKMAYVAGIVAALANEYGEHFRLSIDGEKFEAEEFLLAAFGKGSFYGGGFKALPLSIPNDGCIDACIATKISRMSFIKCVSKYKAGQHLDLSFITYKKCHSVHIESDEPIGVCADGEVTMETVIDVEVVPAALSLSIPEGCELAALAADNAPEEEISVVSPENEEAAI